MNWIAIEDQRPAPCSDVLVYANGLICVDWFGPMHEADDPCEFADHEDDEISHWMPLPEPPEAK